MCFFQEGVPIPQDASILTSELYIRTHRTNQQTNNRQIIGSIIYTSKNSSHISKYILIYLHMSKLNKD